MSAKATCGPGFKRARLSKIRGPFWDHFSWYSLNSKIIHDAEALILRMLPPYLRSLTKQKVKFRRDAKKLKAADEIAEPISRNVKCEA